MTLNRKAILFPAHSHLIDLAAQFGAELKRRRGIASVAMVQGTQDAWRARRLEAFDEVVDVVADLRLGQADAHASRNLQVLSAFEQAHGGSCIWPSILQVQDRGLRFKRYTYNQLLEYMSHSVAELESVFSRWDVLAALGELTSPIYRMGYQMCGKERPYLVPMTARFFHRIYFDDDMYLRWGHCVQTYRNYLRSGIPAEFETVVEPVVRGIAGDGFRPVDFDVSMNRAAKDSGLRRVRPGLWADYAEDIWFNNIIDGAKSPQGRHWTYWLPPRKIARWIQWGYRRNYYHRKALPGIPEKTRFALFLPNFEPEYTLDVQGWPFADQASLIRSIAQSLPVDMLLLVKDHRLMVGPRSAGFYRRILELPNVRLVDERIYSQDLVRASVLALTVTGTVALEALCCGVPVIMFGEVFSNQMEGVTLVRDLYALPEAIEAALKSEEVDYRRSARAALAAMYACSYPGRIDGHMLDPVEMPPDYRIALGDALEAELCRRGLLAQATDREPLERAPAGPAR